MVIPPVPMVSVFAVVLSDSRSVVPVLAKVPPVIP